jgi:hypothetical protein
VGKKVGVSVLVPSSSCLSPFALIATSLFLLCHLSLFAVDTVCSCLLFSFFNTVINMFHFYHYLFFLRKIQGFLALQPGFCSPALLVIIVHYKILFHLD